MKKILINEKIWGHVLIVCFCLNLTSCNSDKKDYETIKIDVNDERSDQLKINFVKLVEIESSKNSLFGETSVFKYLNNKFYILDESKGKALYIFHEDGTFINKTKIGKGPGELLWPRAFAINQQDSIIFIYDVNSSTISSFNYNLDYIKTYKLKNQFVCNFEHINKDSFLVYSPTGFCKAPKHSSYFLLTEEFSKSKHYEIFTENKIPTLLRASVFFDNDRILCIAPNNYNIYEICKDKYKIRYKMDFGEYSFTDDELLHLTTNELDNAKGISDINSLYGSDDFFVLETFYKYKRSYWLYCRNQKETHSINNYMDKNLLPKILIRGITKDGCFYGQVEPEDLKSFATETGHFQDVNINLLNNPYVVFFRIKNIE